MFKVLLLSDSSVITKQIISKLQERKCHITKSNDGLEAFNLLVKEKYDLVITSIQIDVLDGFQLMSAIRASNGINVLTSFIMITSVDSFNEFARLESRPDFVLKKDEKLIHSLDKILKQLFEIEDKVYKLLFIEDDSFAKAIINTWFKKMIEVEFDIVSSISELKETDTSDYDLVISDNMLGDGNIKDVLAVISEKPVIVYTASFSSIKIDTNQFKNLVGIKEKPYDTNYISKMAIKYSK